MEFLTNATPRPLYCPKRDPVNILQKMGGPQVPSVQLRKISHFPENTILGPSSTYTDYAIPTHEDVMYLSKVFAARNMKRLYK